MKTYRLSSLGERLAALLISAIMVAFMAFLCIALRGDLLSLIVCVLSSVLVCFALIFYVVNLLKAAITPRPEESVLEVKGISDFTVSIAGAVTLETAGIKTGPVATRSLIFRNADNEVVASVPAFFTANQGAQAEPLAKELAGVLGLTFKPTLESWEYDKEARKQHQKELAQAEKEQRRQKLHAIKEKLLRRAKTEQAANAPSEEEVSIFEAEAPGSINYDALDDEK